MLGVVGVVNEENVEVPAGEGDEKEKEEGADAVVGNELVVPPNVGPGEVTPPNEKPLEEVADDALVEAGVDALSKENTVF